jgi:hypothetical protein
MHNNRPIAPRPERFLAFFFPFILIVILILILISPKKD